MNGYDLENPGEKELYLKTRDYHLSQEAFELWRYPESGLLETRPRPAELGKYYDSDSYISHTDSRRTFLDRMYQWVKRFSIRQKLRLIDSYCSPGSERALLDVGAGTGDFLLAAQSDGWEVTGIEPNGSARTKASEKGVSLQPGWEGLTDRRFQVITLWHVLEHVPDLAREILRLINALEPNGTLIVAVPNYKSYDSQYYGPFWAAYDVPRHLWHFSRSAMESVFAHYEMQVVATRPMVFDAFYVSLLSEKYKTGKPRYPSAMYRGMRSNLGALKTGEYSSLIYILKRR